MSEQVPLGLQYKWVAKAACAPSAYNTQPARWYFKDDGSIILFEDRRRLLPTADPDEWQHRTAIGAAFEGLRLAASEDGYELKPPSFDVLDLPLDVATSNNLLPRAVTRVKRLASSPFMDSYGVASNNALADPLSSYVFQRHTYTGLFRPIEQRVNDVFLNWASCQSTLVTLSEAKEKEIIAKKQDECTLELLNNPKYYQELYQWRLKNQAYQQQKKSSSDIHSASHVPPQKKMCTFSMFKFWNRLGFGRLFLSDHQATLSASHVVLLTVDRQLSDFYIGRLSYRIWLELTAKGLAVCPLQTLMESGKGRAFLNHQFASEDQAVVMAFRVGQPRGVVETQSSLFSIYPRLPTKELLINPDLNPKNA